MILNKAKGDCVPSSHHKLITLLNSITAHRLIDYFLHNVPPRRQERRDIELQLQSQAMQCQCISLLHTIPVHTKLPHSALKPVYILVYQGSR